MKRAYVDIPEGQMHYRIEGNGEPLLLLHSAVRSSAEYNRAIPFLSKNFRVIAIDFLGHGESDPAPYQYQLLDHAQTVISFMNSLNIKRATIVGHNLGSEVALELQIKWPQRVDKLILSNLGFRPEPGEGRSAKETEDFDKTFTDTVEIKPDGSHLTEWWRRANLWGDPLDLAEERALEYIKAGPRGEEAHWTTTKTTWDPKVRLPLINCPTLILTGTQSWSLGAAGAAKIVKLLPKGKYAVIENGAIHMNVRMPKEFTEAILNFLH
jgi:pimeloyl-ACP methyl ester carboxylesterase